MLNPVFGHRANATRFGSGAVILRARGPEGLSDEEIAAHAPSVFAEDKHASRSERYTYIPTREMLRGLRQAGLMPVEVRQGGSRDEEKRGFTKHLIRLRKAGEVQQALTLGGLYPEVSLLNSHDGTSAYVMDAALMRCVCLNGLMIPEGVTTQVRVPHKGDVIGEVIEGAYRVISDGPLAIEHAGQMDAANLNRNEQLALAAAARRLRWDEGDPQPEPEQLLRPRRAADNTGTVWGAFNAIQENLIRGGVGYQVRDEHNRVRPRASRPVRNIDGDRKINQALWTLAEEMRKLKAA